MARIRVAELRDAEQIADIYAPVVEETPISFEAVAPSAEEIAARMQTTMQTHPWLVAEAEGRISAYAYATTLRYRAAYRWAAETTIYVHREFQRLGVGKALYAALLRVLAAQGFVSVYAGITLENPASVALHEALGFRKVGVFPAVGYKLGVWHDVGFWRCVLRSPPDAPSEPLLPSSELIARALSAELSRAPTDR